MDRNKDAKNQQRPGGPMGFQRPGAALFGATAKAKDFNGTMKKLLKYLKPFRAHVALVILFAVASTIFTIVSPKILGNITNDIVDDYINMTVYDQFVSTLPTGTQFAAGTKGELIVNKMPQAALSKIPSDRLEKIKQMDLSKRPSIDFIAIGRTIAILILLYILSAIFGYLQGWIMSGVSTRITTKLRENLTAKISKLPLKYYDNQTHGDILARLTNDVDTVNQTLNQSLTQMITAITMIFGIAGMMLSISWQLTIVAIMVLPLSFGFIGLIVKKSQKYFTSQADSQGALNGHVEEMFGGHNVVKVFNGEKASLEKFNRINDDLYVSGWKSQFLSGLMMPIMTIIGNLGYVSVAVMGGWLAIKGTLRVGDIQAFIQYTQQFTQPIMQGASITTILQSTAASAERVFEFLEAEEEVAENPHPAELTSVKGNVTFNDVKFGYEPDKQIIKGFTAEAKAGQRIAIVGPTGAGKTTMVNLLMRFYDVNEGSIQVDGVDIRDMKRSSLRRLFGMVLQDTWLFNGTIRENISYGKPDASEEEIIAASSAAQVDHFVHSLPQGYDLELNETADNISQGEKQLLTIARAMLANPPMLILDEATSSVDTRTEVLIQKAMEKLMEGRTSFVIAHRLTTIKNADLILVMNQGNIVEHGTHDELIEQNGFYAGLYNSQFAES